MWLKFGFLDAQSRQENREGADLGFAPPEWGHLDMLLGNANVKYDPDLHKGGTKDIVVDMFDKINSADIFIADISQANANVAYELGYARSKNIETIIVRRHQNEVDVPFDYEHDIRSPYNPMACLATHFGMFFYTLHYTKKDL